MSRRHRIQPLPEGVDSLMDVDPPGVPRTVVIVGAGLLVGDLIRLVRDTGFLKIEGIVDPNPALRGQFIDDLPILGWIGDIPCHVSAAVVGNPSTPGDFDREAVFHLLLQHNLDLPILVSPSARCASDVTLRRGTIVLGGAIIETGAAIGQNCLIGPDAQISRYAAISDNSVVKSGRHVEGSHTTAPSPSGELAAVLASADEPIQEIVRRMNLARAEIILVVDADGALIGTVTDGDIRRGILAGVNLRQPAALVMNRNPQSVPLGTTRDEMLAIMRNRSIRHLPVVDNKLRPIRLERMETIVDDMAGRGAIVMAGGLGMRLRPLTNDTPKPLLPVGGRPILDHILSGLRSNGIEDVVISLNYLGERIRHHVGDGKDHGLSVSYVSERQKLGTAGALALLRPRPRKPFVIMNGDLLTGVNFASLLKFQQEQDFSLVMCVRRHATQIQYGVVDIVDGRVEGLREKPVIEHFINAGIYVLKPSCIDLIPRDRSFDMTDLASALIERREPIGAFPIIEYWRDIGNPRDLREASAEQTLEQAGGDGLPAAGIPMETLT